MTAIYRRYIFRHMDALTRAINHAGTARALADRLGLKPMAITQWKKRGVPAERVLDIVRATQGQVRPYDLRPDVYPDPDWMPDNAA